MKLNNHSWILVGLLAVGITTAAGAAAGTFGNRWGASRDMAIAAERLGQLPESFGDWQAISSQTVEPAVQEMLQCEGSLVRVYQNRTTGQTISMALIVGPTGPMSVHTPEVCYSSRDYKQLNDRRRLVARSHGDAEDAFWKVDFKKVGGQEESLHVAYAWSSGSRWVAPNSARFAFAGNRYLYKLQVATAGVSLSAKTESLDGFLKDALPAVDAALFASSQS